MFKNALIYRITQWDSNALSTVDHRLALARFVECGASQPESAGWVEPSGKPHSALMERVGAQLILCLCVERKSVPSSTVRVKLGERLDKIEQETGRRPKGKQAKELKEEIIQDLLPRAFPKRATTLVWIAPEAGWVVISAGSIKSADRITPLLVQALGGGIVLKLVQTQRSAASAMAEWLQTKEAPAGFTIDRECELKQQGSEKSTVRYARHTLDIDEVAEHITQGKLPTQLAMTWSSRVSFVLTESLSIKKIKMLDGVLEGSAAAKHPDDGGFEADVAISTGEMSQLITDLLEALGGELPASNAPAPEPANLKEALAA